MFILNEKIKNKSNIVNNIKVNNLDSYLKTGLVKHYPSSVKEWYNSFYNYRKDNFIKILPLKDRIIYKIFNTYFNLNKLNYYKNNNLFMAKIFISNPEIKHFNNKVNVTLYIYNRWTVYFYKMTKIIFLQNSKLFLLLKNKPFSMAGLLLKHYKFNQKLVVFVREFFINKFLVKKGELNKNIFDRFMFCKKTKQYLYLYLYIINDFFCYIKLPKVVKILKRILLLSNTGEKRVSNLKMIIKRLEIIYFVRLKINFSSLLIKLIYLYLTINKILRSIYVLRWYKKNVYSSWYKFNVKNMLIIKSFLNKLYNKKIEINIIKLKYLYLDGNILTLAVANKLKDRKRRVLKVIRMALKLSKKPFINKFFSNLLDINNLDTVFVKKSFDLYINTSNIPLNIDLIYKPVSYKSRVMFYYLKHKIISGIKLQGGGRLTKRLTASRSISKTMGKGSLKNRVSSYNGLSTIVLRGYVKSNLQYTNVNSYNRIGAYGIKGWVSSY